MSKKQAFTPAEVFIRYREYANYMDRVHPGKPRLSFRDWLDYGNREGL